MGKLQIWAIDDEGDLTKDAIPGFGRGQAELAKAALVLTELDAGELRGQIEAFLSEFSQIVEPVQGSFGIDEIELALTVNASGGVALIGKLEAGAEAGIKITIRRHPSAH
jgi:hypothetical protein